MGDRSAILDAVARRLGRRDLIWVGLRSDDVASISDLPQLSGAFSIIGGAASGTSIESTRFEDLTGVRVDLDTWDIDDHLEGEEAVGEFRESILLELTGPTAMLPYRSSWFFSSICFARQVRCLDLGLFPGLQTAFEHKPWVETELAAFGVPRIPWVYVADAEQQTVERMLENGPVMLRPSRTWGGEGLVRVDDPVELSARWPAGAESFASVAPFLDDVVPVNIGATVWHDGVTIHHPSVQLIGIPEIVTREFGYCGNDFALAGLLDRSTLDQIEQSTLLIGTWLRSRGYRGTYGLDYLVHEGLPLFTELNPRFQGATHASCRLSLETGQSCLLLDHLAAMLDLDTPDRPPLAELTQNAPPLSHVVIHWTGDAARRLDPAPLISSFQELEGYDHADVDTRPDLTTEPGGTVLRATTRTSITTSGFDLSDPWLAVIRDWNSREQSPGGHS